MNKTITISGATAILGLIIAWQTVDWPLTAEAHYTGVDNNSCKIAFIDYRLKAKELDDAQHRAKDNPGDEFIRVDVVRLETEVFEIKLKIEKVCK